MTLLEILVKELDEWPNGAEVAYQFHYNRCITFRRSEHPQWVSNYYSKYTADERGEGKYITREEYEAAKKALTKPVETPDENLPVPSYDDVVRYMELLEHFLVKDELLLGTQQLVFLKYWAQIRDALKEAYENRPAIEEMLLYIDPAWELSDSAMLDFRQFCTALYKAGYRKIEEK